MVFFFRTFHFPHDRLFSKSLGTGAGRHMRVFLQRSYFIIKAALLQAFSAILSRFPGIVSGRQAHVQKRIRAGCADPLFCFRLYSASLQDPSHAAERAVLAIAPLHDPDLRGGRVDDAAASVVDAHMSVVDEQIARLCLGERNFHARIGLG